MEQVRDTVLDRLCESLGETRDQMAQLQADEKSDLGAALKRMRDKGVTAYRHAGMELARVPGEEKLRARRTSQGASAENLEEGATESAGEDNPIEGGEFGEERAEALEESDANVH